MKFKFKAITVGCIAAMGMASASAVEVAGANLEIYGTLYPQYQTTDQVNPTPTGGNVSNMSSASSTGTAAAAPKVAVRKNQLNWVNSYIGFKGSKMFGETKVSFDLQGTLNKNVDSTAGVNTNNALMSDTRDAFIALENKNYGRLALGQMDTIYKEYGDRVRMLGISSSNFVSTSGIVSGVSWKPATTGNGVTVTNTTAAGTSSFNTRIGGQLRYETPVWNGVQAGFSYRPDANATATQNQTLTGWAVRWTDGKYYAALANEVHNDFRVFSGTNTAVGATSLFSLAPRSKDTATRLSVGYTEGALQLAADVSNLNYTEAGDAGPKFARYATSAWQVSADYALSAQWNIAANYAVGAAGTCYLVNAAACSTDGLGGSLVSLGGKYNYDKNISIYGIYGSNKNNSGSYFGSPTNPGASVTNLAVGVLIKF